MINVTPRHYAFLLEEIAEMKDESEREKELQALALYMMKHHHEQWIDAIGRAYDAMKSGQEVVEIVVRTAKALSAEDLRLIGASLEKELNKSVKLKSEIDPSLIGGAQLRVNHMVIDDSFHHHLNQLRLFLTSYYA